MCKGTGVLWGLLAYITCSILLLQPLFPEVCPSFGQLLWDECDFGPLGSCSGVRVSHVRCGSLVVLLGFSLSDGACGNNVGHRTLSPLLKSGEKTSRYY